MSAGLPTTWSSSSRRSQRTHPPPADAEQEAALWEHVPEPPAAPVTEEGDLWTVGPHRVLCGDSTIDEVLDRIRNEGPARCVLTDPPYAIYGSATGISSSIADDKMVRPFFLAVARAIVRVLPMFGHAYVHCDWRSWPALWEAAKRAELTPKNCLVWDKGSSGLGSMYAQTHEFVAFFVREPEQKAMTSGRPTGQRMIHRPNMLRFPRPTGDEDRQHNAAKPVALLSELITNSTEEGEAVLDLFTGSGSTLIAAHKTGRRGLGVEIEPKWCDVTLARLQRVTGFVPERAGVPVSFLG